LSAILEAAAAAANDSIDSPDFKLPKWVATQRVKALLEKLAASSGYDLDDKSGGGVSFLSNETGLSPRIIYRILQEESVRTSFNNLEEIINHTNLLDLRWTPKEDGGFADAFNGEPQEFPEPTERQLAYWANHRASRERRVARQKKEQERARKRFAREKLVGVA